MWWGVGALTSFPPPQILLSALQQIPKRIRYFSSFLWCGTNSRFPWWRIQKIAMIQTLGGGRPCLVAAAAAVVEQGINITRTSPPNDRPVDEANLINPQIHHHHPRALFLYIWCVHLFRGLFPAIIMHTQPRPVIYPSDRAHTHTTAEAHYKIDIATESTLSSPSLYLF
jgi:hypothetical protein